MRLWNFYFSGIQYGQFENRDGRWYHRQLVPETGALSEQELFSDNGIYKTLCSRDIKGLLQCLDGYEQETEKECLSFTGRHGEIYDRRREDSYIQRKVKFPNDLFVKNGKIFAVLMPGRDYTAVLVEDGMEEETILRDWAAIYQGAVCPVCFEGTYRIPTRDGEELATDVYLPGGGEGPVPAVLVRTPYGKSVGREQYLRFVHRGYAVVIQDVRGREDSTGEWLPNYYEVEDGDDTLNWIAAQPFSDGQVAMTGGSYLGYVQWAAAASGNSHLKAMLSSVCAGSAFVDVPRRGGCFTSGMLAWAFAMSEQRKRGDLMVRDDWEEVLNIRPLRALAKEALGHEVPFLSKWLDHMNCDELWKRSSWKNRSVGNVVPALIISGWFDDNGMGTTEALELVRHYPPGNCKMILGPWMHSGNANYDIHGVCLGQDALRYDMDIQCFKWLEHFLKGVDNCIESSAPVEYYTLGDNCWNMGTAWPVPETEAETYYFSGEEGEYMEDIRGDGMGGGSSYSSDSLNDIAGSIGGLLTTGKPSHPASDSFDYDPQNPSVHIVDMSENELEVPENYTEEEKRPDVLCYTTPVLLNDLTVTGDIMAVLYISSDCPDTDFVVRLTDVDENGTSIKLADGVVSAKYRNGFEAPEFLRENEVYKVCIRTTKISNTFKKGHRMRITVTSSAKNFIFPNSNTEGGFDSEVYRIAHNTIHRGGEYASCVVLPVLK